MDADTFAINVGEIGAYTGPLPGNAQGSTNAVGNALGEPIRVGGGENSTFTDWLTKARDLAADLTIKPVESAYQEVVNAPSRVGDFVAEQEHNVVAAATGFVGWTKWVVIGILAIFAFYIAVMFLPELKGLTRGLR